MTTDLEMFRAWLAQVQLAPSEGPRDDGVPGVELVVNGSSPHGQLGHRLFVLFATFDADGALVSIGTPE